MLRSALQLRQKPREHARIHRAEHSDGPMSHGISRGADGRRVRTGRQKPVGACFGQDTRLRQRAFGRTQVESLQDPEKQEDNRFLRGGAQGVSRRQDFETGGFRRV